MGLRDGFVVGGQGEAEGGRVEEGPQEEPGGREGGTEGVERGSAEGEEGENVINCFAEVVEMGAWDVEDVRVHGGDALESLSQESFCQFRFDI